MPGEENPADLMTKHLVSPKVLKNIGALNMRHVDGRAGKAAQLHRLGRRATASSVGQHSWEAMSERFADRKGGDKWKSKGENGIWHRVHTKPRRARFTPFKVAKEPNSKEKLGSVTFTKGVTQSGKTFEFHDNWLDPKHVHKTLD